jgi:hypothetical protein
VNCPHNNNNNNKKKDEPAFLGMCIRTIESTEEDVLTVYKEEVDVEGYVIIDEEGKETTEYVYSDVVLQHKTDRVEQINMAVGDEDDEEVTEDDVSTDEFTHQPRSAYYNYDNWLNRYDLRCYDCKSILCTRNAIYSSDAPRLDWYCQWCEMADEEDWGGNTLVQCDTCQSFGPDSVECAFCWVNLATPAMENNNRTPIETLKYYHRQRKVYYREAFRKYVWYNHLIFLMETSEKK